MSVTDEQQPELRQVVAEVLRTVAPLSNESAGTLADDVLQRIRRAGFRHEQTPNQVYLAVTNPLGPAPNGYAQDAHASVHHTEDGAQRALDRWAAENPQYRGYVSFDVNPVRINE